MKIPRIARNIWLFVILPFHVSIQPLPDFILENHWIKISLSISTSAGQGIFSLQSLFLFVGGLFNITSILISQSQAGKSKCLFYFRPSFHTFVELFVFFFFIESKGSWSGGREGEEVSILNSTRLYCIVSTYIPYFFTIWLLFRPLKIQYL